MYSKWRNGSANMKRETVEIINGTRSLQPANGHKRACFYLLRAAVVIRSRHNPLSLKNHSLWYRNGLVRRMTHMKSRAAHMLNLKSRKPGTSTLVRNKGARASGVQSRRNADGCAKAQGPLRYQKARNDGAISTICVLMTSRHSTARGAIHRHKHLRTSSTDKSIELIPLRTGWRCPPGAGGHRVYPRLSSAFDKQHHHRSITSWDKNFQHCPGRNFSCLRKWETPLGNQFVGRKHR